jgi:Fringe-like
MCIMFLSVITFFVTLKAMKTSKMAQHMSWGQYPETVNLRTADPPNIQVFVVMTPAHGAYWERFYENSNGWHTQFPDLRSYTFDHIAKDSLLRDASIFGIEPIEGEKSERNNNLLLAAFEQVWKDNNQSDWYFLAEDDTVVIKNNLLRLVEKLNPAEEVFMGKCVLFNDTKLGIIPFAVGGSGMLMSHTLLRKMAPNVAHCRSKYAQVRYGDARIGACVNYSLNRPWGRRESCPPRGFSFSNGQLSQELTTQPPDDFIISLHMKDPILLQHLNKAAMSLKSNLTWRELGRYMNETSTQPLVASR